MQTKAFSLAVGALLLSAGAASATTVTDRVLSCGPSWCRVAWNGTTGYASRKSISSSGGPVYAASPAAGVVAPRYSYTYAWSPYGNWAPYVGYYHWYR
jgi:hypothetical protein